MKTTSNKKISSSKNIKGRVVAIILSAGSGTRMGNRKKTYLKILGAPVLVHAIMPFESSRLVDDIILVVSAGDEERCLKDIVIKYGLKKIRAIVTGGAERQHSVANGIKAIAASASIIAVHDGARPLVTRRIVEETIIAAKLHGCAIAAVPVKDTIKSVKNMTVVKTLPRETLFIVQTPQAFKASILKAAHEAAIRKKTITTDESSLVELIGKKVRIVEGSYENLKITTSEDLHVAEEILRARGVKSR